MGKNRVVEKIKQTQDNTKKNEFLQMNLKMGSVLELGARDDITLAHLKNEGFSCHAIWRRADRASRKNEGISKKHGRIQHIYSKEKYDNILILNNSLQKLKNYWELENALRTSAKRIVTGGKLIVDFLLPQNFGEEFSINECHSLSRKKCKKRKRLSKIEHTYHFDGEEKSKRETLKVFSLEKLLKVADIWDLDISLITKDFDTSLAIEVKEDLLYSEKELKHKKKKQENSNLVMQEKSTQVQAENGENQNQCNEKETFNPCNDYQIKLIRDYACLLEKIKNLNAKYIQFVFTKREKKTYQKGEKKQKKRVVTKKGKVKEVTKTSFIIIMLMVCATSLLLGTKLGNYYIQTYLVKPDYSLYTEEQLLDNISKIKAEGKLPTELSPLQAFLYAEHSMNDLPWRVDKVGEIQNTFANQRIYGTSFYDGEVLTQESISLGFKNVASKIIIEPNGNSLSYIEPEKINGENVTWKSSEERTVEDYREEWGVHPDKLFGYVVSSKTLTKATEWQVDGEGYTASISLDPVTSVILYVKQMEKMSGLSAPTFEYINITFTMDENYKFQEVKIEEKYAVSVGLKVTCVGVLDYVFTY